MTKATRFDDLCGRSETVVTIAVVWCDGHLESCGRLHIIKVKVDRYTLCVKILVILFSIDNYAIMQKQALMEKNHNQN